MTTAAHYFRLPGVQKMIERIADTLVIDNRSVVILLPGGVEPDRVWGNLYRLLGGRDLRIRRLFVDTSDEPIDLLWRAAKLPLHEKPSLDHFHEAMEGDADDHMREDIFYLSKLDCLPAPAVERWMTFIDHWASAAHRRSSWGGRTPILCIIAPAETLMNILPSSNSLLSIFWWSGFPSVLEHQLISRLTLDSPDDVPAQLWRESVLPELAGADNQLFDFLWDSSDEITDGGEPLLAALQSYAEQRQWSTESLPQGIELSPRLDVPFTLSDLSPRQLSQEWRWWWAKGWIGCTPEQGWQVNTAVLAVRGQTQEIDHRLWRGQAHLLLPLVDQIRLRFCLYLNRKFGEEWARNWIAPQYNPQRDYAAETPFEVSLGEMRYLLDNQYEFKAERAWSSLIRQAWQIRNEIAHYKPIRFQAFRELWNDSQTSRL